MFDDAGNESKNILGWWDILRPGVFPASKGDKPIQWKVSPDLCRALSETYDPTFYLAPVTLDHKQEGEAIAWVGELRLFGGVLQARLKDITPTGYFLLENHYYKNRSVEVIEKFRDTEKPYLSGLTFAGAAKPAVSGLGPDPVQFLDHGGPPIVAVCPQGKFTTEDATMNAEEIKTMQDGLFTRFTAWMAEHFKGASGGDQAAALTAQVAELTAQLADRSASVTALETKLSEATAKLAEAEGKLAAQAKAAELAEFTGKLDQLVSGAKITPAEKDGFLKLAENQSAADRTLLLTTLDARAGSPLFTELTAEDKSKSAAGAKPGRAHEFRERAQARLAQVPDDESAKESIAACDLMDAAGNETLTFTAAVARVRAKQS